MAINTRHTPFRTWQLRCAQRHPLSPDLGRGPCLPLPLLGVKNGAGCRELTQQHHRGSGMGRGRFCPQQCQPPAVGSGTAGRLPAGWRRCQQGWVRVGGRKSPKGPWRQRRRCQEGVKGSTGRCQGSVPAWCQRFGDSRTQPAPSTPPPSASGWEERGRNGIRNPFSSTSCPRFPHPAPGTRGTRPWGPCGGGGRGLGCSPGWGSPL